MAKTTTKSGAAFWLVCICIPLLAIGVHYWLFAGVSTPPADFGSGQMFDLIAPRYDLVNRVLAFRMDVAWRQRMVQTVKERVSTNIAQPRLLDIATGTADVALMLAEAIPTSTVIGMDPSHKMLEMGRTKVAQRGMEPQVDLQYRAVEDFGSLEENSFDGATMAFGIRNVPDRQEALCHIHRVLRPGSIFCILEFSEPEQGAGFLGAIARLFIRHVVPVVGGFLSGKPREYLHLQNSIKDFPTPQVFSEMIGSVECDGHISFRFDDLIQMNFGSVQLYIATALGASADEPVE